MAVSLLSLFANASRLKIIISFALIGFTAPALLGQQPVVFEDSAPDRIRIRNSFLALTLSKENGHIVDIVDQVKNISLTLGSQAGCLWTASIFRGTENRFIGGCGFGTRSENVFRYDWDEGAKTLRLAYVSGTSSTPSAIAFLTFSDGPYFDIRLLIQNQTDGRVESVGVPGGLLLSKAAIASAYFPILIPGVRLTPEFFRANRSVAQTYPGQRCFADFFAVDLQGSILSVQTINPKGPIQASLLGLFDNEDGIAGTTVGTHRFETLIRPGASYTSAPVRIQVSDSIEAAIQSYRINNEIAAYPSVREKFGPEFGAISRSPVVRADFQVFGRDFSRWIADLGRIRPPALIHPVGFQPGGHDNTYPDFLPPNPAYGGTVDFRRFADAAAARRFVVMPHTNYTWWNRSSPTLRSLPTNELASLMVQAPDGTPLLETYGNGQQSNSGYVVSPSVARVRSRIEDFWAEWKRDVGISSLFLDQIGARPEIRDFNPLAGSPFEYYDRWLTLTGNSPGMYFSTEGGWDRLAKSMWGFFGSSLSSQSSEFRPSEMRWGVGSPANAFFGSGNWEPYPLATWLFHDKVLFYQHNLELTSYTENIEILSWNALFGFMQIHLWPGTPGRPPDPQWVDLTQAIQRTVSARQAGEPLLEFGRLAPDVVFSRFRNLRTVANWHAGETFSMDGSTIAPSGFLSQTEDRSLIAGVFQGSFANQPISPGTHSIVLEKEPSLVTIRHPIGPDTPFTIEAPNMWAEGAPLVASAVDRDNNFIGTINRRIDGRTIRFTAATVNGQRPSRILLQSGGGLVCTDAAAFQMGPVAPGQMVSVFGTDIGPARAESARLNANGRISAELAGVRLLFNGIPAPLLFVSKDQINAIVPYAAETADSVLVQLEKEGKPGVSVTVPVVSAMPRIFTMHGTGTTPAAAVNEDGKLNSDRNPARRNSVIAVYGTGGGMENAVAADGELARDASRSLRLPITVRIDNRLAEVLYAGAAPGLAGMLQINVRVPAQSARGNSIPIEIRVASSPSQPLVSIAVQ